MQPLRPSSTEQSIPRKQTYVVVSERSDFVVAPSGSGQFEDSSCVDDPCAPAVFDSLARAEQVARSMCVDSNGFLSLWQVKGLPAGCVTEGLAILLLDEFADEAARLRDVFGIDVHAAVST